MAAVIPFPISRGDRAERPLDGTMLEAKVIMGEARLLGTVWYRGGCCSCYRLAHDNQVSLVFDVQGGSDRQIVPTQKPDSPG